jgi:hypothetical protein
MMFLSTTKMKGLNVLAFLTKMAPKEEDET